MTTEIVAWLLVGLISGFVAGVIVGTVLGIFLMGYGLREMGMSKKDGKLYFQEKP